jgi:hypothetical protein
MKIIVFGATGNIGQRIAQEAVTRGHSVSGVVRDPARSQTPVPGVTLVAGDVTDAGCVNGLARGADAVVCAISPRPGTTGHAPSLATAARALIAGLGEAGVDRLVVVGGAGSLEVAPGLQLLDTEGFPAEYKAEAIDARDALDVYRVEAGALDWTFVSPAAMIGPGERTGTYRTTIDRFLTDAGGRSTISFEDYAVAIVDELEHPHHIRRRFGVAY